MSDSKIPLAQQAVVMAYLAHCETTPEGTHVRFKEFSDQPVLIKPETNVYEEAREALRAIIVEHIEHRREIPPSSETRARRRRELNGNFFDLMVPIDQNLALKAILSDSLARSKTSNVQFAKNLGCDEREVRRLLDPDIDSRSRMPAAMQAIDAVVAITVIDTARPTRILRAPSSPSPEGTNMRLESVIATAAELANDSK